jgi:hypothetical protein
MVCKLLKQAPKQWHEKFDRTLISAGFVVNEADKYVYYRFGRVEGVILCLYVLGVCLKPSPKARDPLCVKESKLGGPRACL